MNQRHRSLDFAWDDRAISCDPVRTAQGTNHRSWNFRSDASTAIEKIALIVEN